MWGENTSSTLFFMIDGISLKKVASYDDTGVDIAGLKKVNFIYGANGSGKTTLSKFVANPALPIFQDCSIRWVADSPLQRLVYNKEFKDRNFGKGSIEGVFTLGEATVEDIEKIEGMKGELDKIKDGIIKLRTSKQELQNQKASSTSKFRDIVWQVLYKEYEDDFKDAFRGYLTRDGFLNKTLYEFQHNQGQEVTYERLKKNAETIFGAPPQTIAPISTFEYVRIQELDDEDIWSKKIVGKTDISIGNLIQALNINDWVNEGRAYISTENETCPFCQKPTIDALFRSQLEEYFDKTYTNDIEAVKEFTEEYLRLTAYLENLFGQIETAEKERKTGKIDVDKLTALVRTLQSQFAANRELLHGKIKEPSRVVTLTKTETTLEELSILFADANKEIAAHNKIVDNFAKSKEALIKAVWKFIVTSYKTEIADYIKVQQGLDTGLSNLDRRIGEEDAKAHTLNDEIKLANKNVTSVQPTVDEINRLLTSFGFVNFKIVPSAANENQYQIHREDGSIAEETLSEGEVTFITFLYFLQLAKGGLSAEDVSLQRVLIIDDPVSSLDSSVLFVVSSLIKEILKAVKNGEGNIKQVILLTHNVYFHKEVSYVDSSTRERGDTFYWILRRNGNLSAIQCYEMKNPIQDSYSLLWQELKNKEHNSGVTIQNTMRRIIENYFRILGNKTNDTLLSAFTTREEKEICRSLLTWINDGSHMISDDLYIEHHENLTDKYFKVFEGIFKHSGHLSHYEMMMNN